MIRPISWRTALYLAVAIGLPVGAKAAPAVDFTLREHLGHAWSNECVTFALTENQLKAVRERRALLGPGGAETAWQLIETGAVTRVAFQAGLAPYATAEYAFADASTRPPATDLVLTESGDVLRLANGLTGVELRTKLQPGEGPIARIRLGTGTWTGDSTLEGSGPVSDYRVEVVAKGPVFAEALCQATFADGGRWTLRVRLERGEPVVRVDEQFDAPSGGTCRVTLGSAAFRPTHLLHRNSDVTSCAVMSDPLADYLLEPWLHWNNPRHGNWIALYTPTPVTLDQAGEAADARGAAATLDALRDETSAKPRDPRPDLLVVAVLRPSLWRDPNWRGRAEQVAPQVQVKVRDGLATLELPVRGGRRLWLLGALDKSASAAILLQKNRRVAPPPQQLVIKHGDFPLERVKDYVLDWAGDADSHPLLYIRKPELPALKARLTSDPAEIHRWTSQQPIDKYFLDGPIREFVASGNARLGCLMAAKGAEYLQTCTDWYLKQDERNTLGAAPHMQSLIITALNLLDPVLSTDAVTPEVRKRILAQFAFLGYVVNSPDYWSQERGYCGFANMSSIVALYQTGLGCMVPAHPRGREWAQRGLDELHRELLAWSDEDGGWLEAPHYAMVTFDHLLGGFTMGANAGFSDYAFDPRMRKVIDWFAAISTPRDSRTGGFRHQPPIGNTYHGEPTGVYGLVAGLWKERDPAFAARMQWMFEQHGSFGGLGIGWNFPAMLGYRFLFTTHGVAPQPADYGSAWFRKTGVVLRNTLRSDRETYLHLIAGSNHDHYDCDSGSIILYGKGRVLADDWGYIGRHPEKWHSMLTSPAAGGGGEMQIETFAPAATFDYVSGRKGAWQRQIAFAKDADPLGPNFFLIRDTHTAGMPALWRLWLTAATPVAGRDGATPSPGPDATATALDGLDEAPGQPAAAAVTLHAAGATVRGADDVDLDIFIYQAERLNLRTETATQKVTCGYRNGQEGPLENTQTAILATLPGAGAVTALLYPRLKTEPPPTVTWFADGHIAEVKSAAGTDHIFLTSKQHRSVDPDGRSLLPLWGVTRDSGRRPGLVYTPADGDLPHCRVNASDADVVEGSFRQEPRSVVLHPGTTNAATAVWQSPIAGTVAVEVKLRDGDTGGSDGIAYELRQGSRTLVQGVVTNGGQAAFTSEPVTVAKGELLRLLILPRESNWWDTTRVEMRVRQTGGGQWNLGEAVLNRQSFGNAAADPPAESIWWVCEGDAAAFDPRVLSPARAEFAAADRQVVFQGTAGAVQSRGGRVILSLGAAGEIRAGNRRLAADAAASKTED